MRGGVEWPGQTGGAAWALDWAWWVLRKASAARLHRPLDWASSRLVVSVQLSRPPAASTPRAGTTTTNERRERRIGQVGNPIL
jgi:hypothetical protein